MGQALYRAYRSKHLSEIVGQEHVTTALDRALKKGTISHAYLFTGPRGVGKTSIARILAHEINGLPYEDDATHLDIIEIDAASNRRIDEIRDLRDKVHIAPSSAKYKVYIIDEVHMLTKEAFNALLKTLEEPPAHAIFILATTEAHKLPETIISRTQRYAFKPVELPKVVAHLKDIAQKEKITITDDALELIAAHGDGSFRDSISLLDQVRNSGENVTLADVQAILGLAPKELVEQLIAGVGAQDPVTIATQLQHIQTGGHNPAQVAKQIGEQLRAGLLAGKPALPHAILMELLAKLIDVPASANPRSYLEIALLDAALAGTPAASSSKTRPTPQAPTAKSSTPKVMSEPVQSKPVVQVEPHPRTFQKAMAKQAVEVAPIEDTPPQPQSSATVDERLWPEILGAIKQKHNTLYSIVRTARPHFTPGLLTLECGFVFHQKRLQETRNKSVLAEVVKAVTGEDLQVQCTIGEGQAEPPLPTTAASLPPEDGEIVHTVIAKQATPEAPANTTVTAISNIFGSAEVLES
jgi:DNA polymerase III subunit gamma/tau